MINIHKLITAVKKGTLPFDHFNLKIKRHAAQYADDDWSDEALEWRMQQQQAQQSQQAVEEPEAGISSPIGRSAPQPQQISQIPEEVYDTMDNWWRNFRTEMEREADSYPVEVLRTKSLDESPIQAAPGLYRIIRDNDSLTKELVNRIVQNTRVKDPDKALAFVDTMKAKSKDIEQQLGDESAQSKADAELKKREEAAEAQKIRNMERAKERDPYSIADPTPDPMLDQVFDVKWYNSTGEEKAAVFSLIGNFSDMPDEPARASKYRFGEPEKGQAVDQRMNFFLNYPQHLQGVMDSKMVDVLSEEMPKMGLNIGDGSPSEIMSGLKGFRGDGVPARTKGRILNILNNEKGPQLHNILKGLIEAGSPDIYKWLEPVIKDKFNKNREDSYDAGVEGDNSGIGNMGIDEENVAPQLPEADIYEEYESSQILGNIAKQYLVPILNDSRGVMKGAIGSMFSSARNQYDEAVTEKDKKDALENFSLAEILNTFNVPIVDHIERLFQEKGKKKGDIGGAEPLMSIYKTKDGRVSIPEGIVHDMYKKIDGEEKERGVPAPSVDDYKGLVERYIYRINNKTAKPYIPEWRNMISHRYPVDIFKFASKLKTDMRTYAKENNIIPGKTSLDGVRVHFDKIKDPKKNMSTLAEFAGVRDNDPESVRVAKINDYVYMTLLQPEYDVKWLDELGPRKEGKVLKSNNAPFHNLKAYIGDNYHKFLGYLANKKDIADDVLKYKELMEKASYQGYVPTTEDIEIMNIAHEFTEEDVAESEEYTDDALSVIIGLMDHHGDIRNFLRNGASINWADRRHRTNTELYYDLRGVEPPEYIKALFELRNVGLAESNKIDKKTGQPKLAPGSWFHSLFREYWRFDPVIRGLETATDTLESIEQAEEEHYQAYNNGILLALNNPKTKPPDKGYKQRLAKIKDPVVRATVDQKIQNWINNPTERLEDDIYTLLSYSKFESKERQKRQLRKKQIEDGYVSDKGVTVKGIKQYEEESQEIKANLKKMIEDYSGELAQNNIDVDTLLPRLRLASEEYRRVLVKIASLEHMKKMKFASAGYTDYIDIQIARIKTEFDRYFESLFV